MPVSLISWQVFLPAYTPALAREISGLWMRLRREDDAVLGDVEEGNHYTLIAR